MKKGFLALLICCLSLSSCTNRLVDFTIISTKNIDFTKGASFQKGKSRIKGEDLAHWIIIIPTKQINIKEAIDKAIESTPGCVALLDGVLYSKFWWIPYIYGQQSFVVEGTPLIDPSVTSDLNDTPSFRKFELDNNGQIKKVENISSSDYYALKSKIVKDTYKSKFDNTNELE